MVDPLRGKQLEKRLHKGADRFRRRDQEAAECDRSCSDSLNGATKETPMTTLSFSSPDLY